MWSITSYSPLPYIGIWTTTELHIVVFYNIACLHLAEEGCILAHSHTSVKEQCQDLNPGFLSGTCALRTWNPGIPASAGLGGLWAAAVVTRIVPVGIAMDLIFLILANRVIAYVRFSEGYITTRRWEAQCKGYSPLSLWSKRGQK